jgi:hypothetical protein
MWKLVLALICSSGMLLASTSAMEPPAKDGSVEKTARDFKRGISDGLRDGQRQSGVGQASGGPTITSVGAGTSVLVPDGGTASIGRVSSAGEGSGRFGPPLAGKSRPFTNGAYGRSHSTTQASVRVRVIILAEEEERQTGYSSRGRR